LRRGQNKRNFGCALCKIIFSGLDAMLNHYKLKHVYLAAVEKEKNDKSNTEAYKSIFDQARSTLRVSFSSSNL
jgi:hypothetical protein